MPTFGFGPEVVTSATRPATPAIGQLIYQTDTDEYLKYVSYGGANRWMQAVPKPNRNLIINGDFGVAQRSTGSVALTNTAAYCGVDRWMSFQVGTAQSTKQQVTTALPTQATNGVSFKSGVRIGRNVGSTNTAYITLFTAMETVDCVKAQGKKVTLSFWMKGGAGLNLSGNSVSVVVNSGTGTDQSNSSQMSLTGITGVIQTSAVVSSSWQYFTYTGTVPASATQLGVYVYPLTFGAAAAIADDNVYFTGMQLEIGSAPSEFEFEQFETTLRKCKRYYVRKNVYAAGSVGGSFNAYIVAVQLEPQMRIAPVPAWISGGIAMDCTADYSITGLFGCNPYRNSTVDGVEVIYTGPAFVANARGVTVRQAITQFNAEL